MYKGMSLLSKKSLQPLLEVFDHDPKQQIDLASLMMPLTDPEEIANPNNVKVVVDRQSFALYFSRSPIPFARDTEKEYTYKKHIGVYAFRKDALMEFYRLSPTPLEEMEKLEQLRYLENGRRIKMVLSEVENIGIDTPEDLEKARKYWKNIY